MSPPATFTLASPASRPAVSVLMASARTGPAASVKPAADAADAVMKPRRDNGAALVRPSMSCILVRMFMVRLPVDGAGLRPADAAILQVCTGRSWINLSGTGFLVSVGQRRRQGNTKRQTGIVPHQARAASLINQQSDRQKSTVRQAKQF